MNKKPIAAHNNQLIRRVSVWLTMLCVTLFVASASAQTTREIDALLAGNQLQAAQTAIARVLSANPNSARAQYTAAVIAARLERYDEARQRLEFARQRDPQLSFANPTTLTWLTKVTNTAPTVTKTVPAVTFAPPSWSLPVLIVTTIALVALVAWGLRTKTSETSSRNVTPTRDGLTPEDPTPISEQRVIPAVYVKTHNTPRKAHSTSNQATQNSSNDGLLTAALLLSLQTNEPSQRAPDHSQTTRDEEPSTTSTSIYSDSPETTPEW